VRVEDACPGAYPGKFVGFFRNLGRLPRRGGRIDPDDPGPATSPEKAQITVDDEHPDPGIDHISAECCNEETKKRHGYQLPLSELPESQLPLSEPPESQLPESQPPLSEPPESQLLPSSLLQPLSQIQPFPPSPESEAPLPTETLPNIIANPNRTKTIPMRTRTIPRKIKAQRSLFR
jgi:hypothetical protein